MPVPRPTAFIDDHPRKPGRPRKGSHYRLPAMLTECAGKDNFVMWGERLSRSPSNTRITDAPSPAEYSPFITLGWLPLSLSTPDMQRAQDLRVEYEKLLSTDKGEPHLVWQRPRAASGCHGASAEQTYVLERIPEGAILIKERKRRRRRARPQTVTPTLRTPPPRITREVGIRSSVSRIPLDARSRLEPAKAGLTGRFSQLWCDDLAPSQRSPMEPVNVNAEYIEPVEHPPRRRNMNLSTLLLHNPSSSSDPLRDDVVCFCHMCTRPRVQQSLPARFSSSEC